MTLGHTRNGPPVVYEVARQFVEEGWKAQGSLFSPGAAAWTGERFLEVRLHFIDQPDQGKREYLDKLHDQMSGSSDEAKLLLAELHLLHLLPTLAVKAKRKREVIEAILGWMDEPVGIPDGLAPVLDAGFLNPGQYFLARRDRQLAFLVEVGERLASLDTSDRAAVLADPWRFKAMLHELPDHSAFTQREALLHLVHRDTFEAIVSREHKTLIAKRYADLITHPTDDIDERLSQIRQGLTGRMPADFDFYDPALIPEWQGAKAQAAIQKPPSPPGEWDQFVRWAKEFHQLPDFDAAEEDYKLKAVAPLVDARRLLSAGDDGWLSSLKRGFGNQYNNLTPYRDHDRFVKWALDNPEAARTAVGELWETAAADDVDLGELLTPFFERLPIDVVPTPGSRVAIASYLLLSLDPERYPMYRPTPFSIAYELTGVDAHEGDDLVRRYGDALDFIDRFMAEAEDQGLDIEDRLEAQGLVWCVTKWPPPDSWDQAKQDALISWRTGVVPEAGSVADLSRSLHLGSEFLPKVHKLLAQKKQIVLHGPPGTGKTYVARKYAEHLAGEDGTVETVQFHPSYAYEDFVEGYRPDSDGDGFTLRPGPLKRLAKRAAEDPEATHVLLIDELNRGNVAKVFGELYFLLEYRDESLTLQYSDDAFALPDNLWIIGTMNTADRSIAIVDGALRRRFYFVGFYPDEEPVRSVLRSWLAANKPEMLHAADLVDAANERLGDRQVSIGPSHLMREDLDEEWLELVWEHSVLPYVAENLYGEEDRIKEFELARLQSALTDPVEVEPPSEASDADPTA